MNGAGDNGLDRRTSRTEALPSTVGRPNIGTVDLPMATTKRGPARTRKPAPTRRAAPRKRPSDGRARPRLACHPPRSAVRRRVGRSPIAVGLVAALGIYADFTGPVGRFLRDVAGLFFGWGRLALPVAVAGVGLALLEGRPRQEPARVVIGTSFLVVAASGLIHLSTARRRGPIPPTTCATPAASSAPPSPNRCGRCSPSPAPR